MLLKEMGSEEEMTAEKPSVVSAGWWVV